MLKEPILSKSVPHLTLATRQLGLACLATPIALSCLSAQAEPAPPDRFEQHAYWTCPDVAPAELATLYDTGWKAVFTALKDSGVLIDFGAGRPLGAFTATQLAPGTHQDTDIPYHWFAWYQSDDADMMDGFWQTFTDTAGKMDPATPGPFELCSTVLVVNYAY